METGAERGQMCLGPLSLSGRGSGSTRTTNPGAGGTNRLAWGVRDLLARSSGSWGAILTQLTLQRQQPRVKSNKSSTLISYNSHYTSESAKLTLSINFQDTRIGRSSRRNTYTYGLCIDLYVLICFPQPLILQDVLDQ